MEKDTATQIKTELQHIFAKLDEGSRSIYDDYLYKRGHLDRLIYMLDSLLPYCKPDAHLVDMGSNVVFPYLVKSIAKVKECEGLSMLLDHGQYVVIDDDYSVHYEPLRDFPYDSSYVEQPGIVIPMVHCNLSTDRLPYKTRSIDILTCFETLEHLRCDPMHVMAEANRVIREDGVFMLTTPNANSMSNLKKMIHYESPNFYPPFIRNQDVIEHVKEYSIQEIKLLFDSAGFEIVKLDTFNHIDSEQFNHYEAYQVSYAEADAAALEELRRADRSLEDQLAGLLSRLDGGSDLRGDYIHVVARRVSDVKNRYCFPLYEH